MKINKLYDLKEKLCTELENMAAGTINGSNLSMIDTLAHSIKNIGKIIAMEEGGEYSSYPGYGVPMGGHYSGTYGGESYARGRDMRGRYSRGGSRMDMISNLEEMLEEAPSEGERMAIQRCIDQLRK